MDHAAPRHQPSPAAWSSRFPISGCWSSSSIPFVIVFKISLSQTAIAMPPYVPVLDLGEGLSGLLDGSANCPSTTTSG